MKKSALITGSTSGIGKATATALAQLGWKVIIHGRQEEKCQAVAGEIRLATGNPQVVYLPCDLSDLSQVVDLARSLRQQAPDLNVLILNAGTFSQGRIETVDGLERTWVVNYLSRFLLTRLILDLLRDNEPSRIIDVSGMYHAKGDIHLEDIQLTENYSMAAANNQSKLANVLFTHRLARDLSGSRVTINTLHPGAVKTDAILRAEGFSPMTKALYRLFRPFFKTPEKGAETSVFLATSPNVANISGAYFVNKKPRTSAKKSHDVVLQDTLWQVSEEMVKDWL